MKTFSYLKSGFLQVILVSAVLFFTSCSNENRTDTKEIAEESNEGKFGEKDQEKDAQFLVDAAEINLQEIQLGKLAQQKGVTGEVRELGRTMEAAHTKLQSELTALAQSKMISIPTSPTEDAIDAYNKLNEKSGNNFDKEYADKLVNRHKDAIDLFEDASSDCNDPDIRNWATTSLTDLRKHLDHSMASQRRTDEL